MHTSGIRKQFKKDILNNAVLFFKIHQVLKLEHYLFCHKSNLNISENNTNESTLNKKASQPILPNRNNSKALSNKTHIGIRDLNIPNLHIVLSNLKLKPIFPINIQFATYSSL